MDNAVWMELRILARDETEREKENDIEDGQSERERERETHSHTYKIWSSSLSSHNILYNVQSREIVGIYNLYISCSIGRKIATHCDFA